MSITAIYLDAVAGTRPGCGKRDGKPAVSESEDSFPWLPEGAAPAGFWIYKYRQLI